MSASPFDISPARIASLHAIRDRHIGTATTTQRDRLLDALKTLGHVTTFEAMRCLDIFDPRPRKLELLEAGHRIVTARRIVVTEAGVKHRIGVYMLVRESPGGDAHRGALGKEKAPDAIHTPKASKNTRTDDTAQLDFTPEAAAWAIQTGLDAGSRALQFLGGANPHASLIAVTEGAKAFAAGADSLRIMLGG